MVDPHRVMIALLADEGIVGSSLPYQIELTGALPLNFSRHFVGRGQQ